MVYLENASNAYQKIEDVFKDKEIDDEDPSYSKIRRNEKKLIV